MTGREEYQNYLKSWRWQLISRSRKWLDRYRCQTCHEKHGLQAHHASYKNRGKFGIGGFIDELHDTVTLRDDCHKRIHDRRSIREFSD